MRFVAVFADGTATLTQIKGAGILADADSITELVHSPGVGKVLVLLGIGVHRTLYELFS